MMGLGVSSDHILRAGPELYPHIACMFSCILTHGTAPRDMVISTVIPIPKGRNSNITNADNYRGIALSAILEKLLDLIILVRYGDLLCSSDLQFGYKHGRLYQKRPLSTMCITPVPFIALFWMPPKRSTVLSIVGYFDCY